MKKSLRIGLCLSTLLVLISCGMKTSNSDSQNTSNPDSSGLESSSSSLESSSSSSSSKSSSSSSSSSNSSSSQSSSSNSSSSASSNSSSSSSSSGSSSSAQQDVYYTVTFLNYNNALLKEVSVKEGETAVYDGATPTRVEEDGYIYTFDGWDQPITNITSNLTVKATYSKTPDSGWGPIIWM